MWKMDIIIQSEKLRTYLPQVDDKKVSKFLKENNLKIKYNYDLHGFVVNKTIPINEFRELAEKYELV